MYAAKVDRLYEKLSQFHTDNILNWFLVEFTHYFTENGLTFS